MLSSMLFPNTQKNSMLPSRWPHPPCRNIEMIGVNRLIGSRSTTQAIPSPSGTASPTAARPVISPGTRPRLHTAAAIASERPAPSTTIHTATVTPMMSQVIHGV
jgi:hypothetical protein